MTSGGLWRTVKRYDSFCCVEYRKKSVMVSTVEREKKKTEHGQATDETAAEG